MSGTPDMHSNWADMSPLDGDTEKMLNSFLADLPSQTHDTSASHTQNSAPAWPGSVHRSLSDNAPFFGLSPSLPLGISPGLANFYHDSNDPAKSDNTWSFPSEMTGDPAGSSASSMYTMASLSMPPSLPTGSADTPSDATSLRADMVHPLGTVPSSTSCIEDVVDLGRATKDTVSTPQLSPASLGSHPSPLLPNNTLTGYHTNIATDHAQHLADLVKTSTLLNAGHPGPRSLASSLSRSVLNVDAIGRPDAVSEPSTSLHAQTKGLTIQQRRRLSHIGQSNTAALSEANAQQTSSTVAPPTVSGRSRQKSAPDPILPPLGSSPEMPRTPLQKPRRAPRASISGLESTAPWAAAGLAPAADNADTWSDAVVTNSHDLVFVLSLKGTVLYMSPSVQRILGFHPEEIIGRPLVDFSHPADVGPFSRELKEAITLPNGDDEGSDCENTTAVKAHRRVDLIMRMACKDGTFSLIETTGRVSVDPPKHRKVVVCSGRPHPIPMLPWNDVRQDLLTSELSAWLKISHNGIFLGATGPIHQILGIEDINLLGRHVRDLPMVTSSSDLLDALRSGRCISVQDHYEDPGTAQKAPVKLTVYPWTSNGRSHSVSFVHVQQQPHLPDTATHTRSQSKSPVSTASTVPAKRKASEREPGEQQDGSGSLSGSAFQANGTSVPVMTANDAASTVFSELTGFHSGSWLIEMQKLHNANRRLRHELTALRKRSSHASTEMHVVAC
ncbi:hypothetical protein PaG_06610 [Moesziomyces aphidis]|jgi:PAS domain-containing protein|uniref:PAS domain-containing protein n=1 Tax=Moesziomyces aphidis TaxID=84754 RepID=W3VDG3_MOEAP|nr:hypothetical protein PaG_06610 [Moesziomyces aphidis]